MNNLLFRVAELEEKLEKLKNSDNELERLIGEAQFNTLEVFKFHPIRSQEESGAVLKKLNSIFGNEETG